MGKSPFSVWHAFGLGALILAIGITLSFLNFASAQTNSGGAITSTVELLPEDAVKSDDTVRTVESGTLDLTEGINVGSNFPTGAPGGDTLPIPSFSGINAPVWVNRNGPVQVADDAILWGLTDVRVGLMNSGGGGAGPKLTIALADADTPIGSDVLQGSSPDVTKINFTASGGDIIVTRFVVTRAGNSTESDVFTICPLEGNNPLVGASLLECDVVNDAEAGKPTYTTFLNWTIPNGQTKQLTLRAKVSRTATVDDTFTLGIASSTDVTVQSGTVTGSATGNEFTIAAPAAKTLTVALSASNPSGRNVTRGTTNDVLSLDVTNNDPTTYAFIDQIRFHVLGTIDNTLKTNDVTNFNVYDGVTQLTDTSGEIFYIGSDQFVSIDFPIEPLAGRPLPAGSLLIAPGMTKTLRFTANVKATAVVGKTFKFQLDDPVFNTWIHARTYNQNGIFQDSIYTTTGTFPLSGNTFTVAVPPAVELTTIDIGADGVNNAASAPRGSRGLHLGNFKLTPTARSTLMSIELTKSIVSTTPDANIRNLQLIDRSNGATLATAANLIGGKAKFNLTAPLTIEAARNLAVFTDIATDATLDSNFTLSLADASAVTAITADGAETAVVGVPYALRKITVIRPDLKIALGATPAAANVSRGQANLIATKISFSATPNAAVSVTNITVTRSGLSANAALQNLRIYDDVTGNQLAAPVANLDAGGRAVFNLPIPWQIAASSSRTLRIVTDVAGGAAIGSTFSLGITAGGVISPDAIPQGLPVDGSLFTIVAAVAAQPAPSLFGSFIPTAYAQAVPLIETHPVSIYDDLYIQGNRTAAEPGNLFIQGNISNPTATLTLSDDVQVSGLLTANGNLQVLNDLNVLGATSVASLSVANGAQISNGVQVSGDIISLNGNVRGYNIGSYYRLENMRTSTTAGVGAAGSISAVCGNGDIVVSCSGSFPLETLTGTTMSDTKTCTASGFQKPNTINRILTAQALCFNPNASDPTGHIGTKAELNP